MSSLSSSADRVLTLNNIVTQANRYFATFIFIFGCVGNIMNIFVLSQSLFVQIPVQYYSSVAALISLIAGLSSRMLSSITIDLSDTVRWICKMRGFTLFTFRAIAF
ncbi:unnamed protein product [Adineta steineri]|uniref:Uncharacterized protein n=1 Tax=Adineta steineri TaxID=433720 RepID=A0A813VA80_9BILA|nr:unnamed protein product [Adineta steineri]CAF4077056.1 unnamed protein product [Adineta steineri]